MVFGCAVVLDWEDALPEPDITICDRLTAECSASLTVRHLAFDCAARSVPLCRGSIYFLHIVCFDKVGSSMQMVPARDFALEAEAKMLVNLSVCIKADARNPRIVFDKCLPSLHSG